jgi:hypothetical protein
MLFGTWESDNGSDTVRVLMILVTSVFDYCEMKWMISASSTR